MTGGRLRLGRGSDNDVVLSDVSVSRYHAEILREPNGWSIHDLQSTNGVEVNRVPVERAPLAGGDLLTIGSFERRRHAEEPPPRPKSLLEEAGESTLAGLSNATIIRPLSDFAAAYGLGEGAAKAPPPKGGAGLAAAAAPAPPVTETEEQAYVHRMFGFLTRLARMLTLADSVD